MTWGSLSASANHTQAPLFLLHVTHKALKWMQRSCGVSSQRSYPSTKKGCARQVGRRLHRPRQSNREHHQVRTKHSRGEWLRSWLYYEVQRSENTWDIVQWRRCKHQRGQNERELGRVWRANALFIPVKYTAHWFNGNTILIFRSPKTKTLFLTICHRLIG